MGRASIVRLAFETMLSGLPTGRGVARKGGGVSRGREFITRKRQEESIRQLTPEGLRLSVGGPSEVRHGHRPAVACRPRAAEPGALEGRGRPLHTGRKLPESTVLRAPGGAPGTSQPFDWP
jgi:hypothetical protein